MTQAAATAPATPPHGATAALVLADGTVVSSLNKMLKNNAGYDLKQLFIGTEGTLGVVTRAVLRLWPKLPSKVTALCALRGFDEAVALLHSLQSQLGGSLSAFEAMWASYVADSGYDGPLVMAFGFGDSAEMADELNRLGVLHPSGTGPWTPELVRAAFVASGEPSVSIARP